MNEDTAQITRDIVALAEMTAKTGNIYDLQRENLKNYGIIAFGRLFEVWVDTENCLVTYTLKKQLFGKPEVLGRTIGHLEKAIRNLFETPSTRKWRLAVEDTTGVLYVSNPAPTVESEINHKLGLNPILEPVFSMSIGSGLKK